MLKWHAFEVQLMQLFVLLKDIMKMRSLLLYLFISLLTISYGYHTARVIFGDGDRNAFIIADEMDCEEEKEKSSENEKSEKEILYDDLTFSEDFSFSSSQSISSAIIKAFL